MQNKSRVGEIEKYLQSHPKKYIIFDFDGTLAKLNCDWIVLKKAAYNLIKQVDFKMVQNLTYINVSYTLFNQMLEKHGESFRKSIKEIYPGLEPRLFIGATYNEELFAYLNNNRSMYHYYIWSNNNRSIIDKVLSGNNSLDLFDQIITSNDVRFYKPNIEGFEKYIMLKEKIKTSEWLLVGDALPDEIAAQNLGIDFFKLVFQFKV